MTINKANLQDLYALSPMQEGMLFHALSQPASRAYFEQTCYTINGALHVELFKQSWQLLLNRHDALRTVFVHNKTNKLLQMVLKHRTVDFTYTDLSALTSDAQQQQIETYRQQDKAKGFDLSKDLLSRVQVLKIQEQHFMMVWSVHHIIADAWCSGIIYHELLAFYHSLVNNQPCRLPPAPPYNRYIKWLAAQNNQAARDFWQQYLHGYSEAVSLYAHSPSTTDYVYAVQKAQLSADDSRLLRQAATQAKVTLNTLVQTAWALLLRHHNQCDDVVFGVTVSGRPAAIANVEQIIGLFINTIPLRVTFDENRRVLDVVQQLQQQAVTLQSHDYFPLAEIQGLSALKQNLINHLLIFENVPQADEEGASSLLIKQTDMFEHSHYPLMLSINPDDKITFTFSTNQLVYSANQISRVAEQLCHLLRQLTALDIIISELNPLPTTERDTILDHFSALPDQLSVSEPLLALWAKQIAERPDAIAVSDSFEQLSFSQLNDKANRLAHYLMTVYNLQAEDKIAILLPRNVDLVVALWAIVKTGAAYVPLDASYPKARLDYILEHSQSCLLLTTESSDTWAIPSTTVVTALGECTNTSNPNVELPPNRLAYLIYTSGSTGQPKGVMVEHSNVAAFCANMANRFDFTADDKLLALTTVTFDISVLELLTAFTVGLQVVVANDTQVQNPNSIVQLLKSEQITVLQATPSRLQWLIQAGGIDALQVLRVILVGGEALPEHLAQQLCQLTQTSIINVYGPTETTIWSSSKQLDNGQITIGTALAHEALYILSPKNEVQAIGVIGEIVIGGSGVSRGYWQDEQRTVQAFTRNPFHLQQRVYRTGDNGRWCENGEIEFLGRKDEQVKIRGYRIELGEIEQRILNYPSISQAAVINSGSSESALLRAFVVTSTALDSAALRDYLAQWLPDFMLPTQFVVLDDLPLNNNGKVNRKALAASTAQGITTNLNKPHRAARNALEQQAVELWQQTLQQTNISIDDDFFSLGGNSINAIQLTSQLSKLYGQEIALITFLANPSIAGLANVLLMQQQPMGALNHRPQQRIIFCFPPIMGFGAVFKELANQLSYGCYAIDFVVNADFIVYSVDAIKQVQTQGPYVLLGYSLGCNIAFAVAEALQQQGDVVQALLLIDGVSVLQPTTLSDGDVQQIIDNALLNVSMSDSMSREKLQTTMRNYLHFALQQPNQSVLRSSIYYLSAEDNALNNLPFSFDVASHFSSDWSTLTQQKFSSYLIKGEHNQLLEEPFLSYNASIIQSILNTL